MTSEPALGCRRVDDRRPVRARHDVVGEGAAPVRRPRSAAAAARGPDERLSLLRDDQVRTGWLIALLRSAELSLDEIAGIVGASADGLASLERAADGARRRAESNQAVLARARLHLRGEPSMPEPTIRIEGTAQCSACYGGCGRTRWTSHHQSRSTGCAPSPPAAGLTVTGRPFGIFHGPITDDSNGPLEITLPVDGLLEPAGRQTATCAVIG